MSQSPALSSGSAVSAASGTGTEWSANQTGTNWSANQKAAKSYLQEAAANLPAPQSPAPADSFGHSAAESWKAPKTGLPQSADQTPKSRQAQIEAWFDQYFDQEDTDDDPYRSLGPQHDGETLSPSLAAAFDQGWDGGSRSEKGGPLPGRGKSSLDPAQSKPASAAPRGFQDESNWLQELFSGNSLHSGENNGIKDYENIADSVPDINALNAGGGLIRADERDMEQIQQRYQHNLEIENEYKQGLSETDDGHINGQGRDPFRGMSFGPAIEDKYVTGIGRSIAQRINGDYETFGTVANAGCEAIAVYNTLYDLGVKDISLSQIIYDTERMGNMLWNGWFGTKIWKVDDMLNMYGVSSQTVSPAEIQASADNGTLNPNQIFVATVFNNRDHKITGGIHTFEIVYLPNNTDQPWVVYNRNNASTAGEPYADLNSILEGRGEYILLHQINGG